MGAVMMTWVLRAMALVVSVLLAPGTASAAFVPFTDRALFESVLTGEATIDFEGIAPNGSFVQYSFPGYNNNGVVFYGQSSDPQNTIVSDKNAGFTSGPYNSDILFITNKFVPLRIEAVGGVSGIGGFFGGLSGSTAATLDVFGVSDPVNPMTTFSFTAGDIALSETFFGVVSTGELIGKVLFTPATDFSAVDNLTYSTAPVGVIPVPPAALLFGSALGVMGLFRSRKKSAA